MEFESIYCDKPWTKFYDERIPEEFEIPRKTINEAFDESCKKWKDKVALIFYGKKIKYHELKDKVDRFANALHHIGIRKGDRVGLLLLNSPEFVISFYGAAKAGAIITAISPIYVSVEIKHQLMDSGAETIICQDIFYHNLEKTGLKLKNVITTSITDSLPFIKKMYARKILKSIYERLPETYNAMAKQEGLLKLKDLIDQHSPKPPKIEISPDDPVTLQYTGGTTGPPKGAIATHFNMISGEMAFNYFYPFSEGKEVYVSFMPFYHAGGLSISVISGILRGYRQTILSAPDLDKILTAISMNGVTVFYGSPALYEMLKGYEKTSRVNWKKLKAVISTADALNEVTAKDYELRTGIQLHEMWGMTESTIAIIANPLMRPKLRSIGIPMPNAVVSILDDKEDKFLPMGELGELAIASPSMAVGYWNNPGATKECEAKINNVRWWRTGDIARMDEEGYFFIYDRKRDLIKYKGLKIFAREVEEVLKKNPKIKEVGVVGINDVKVGQIPKAFVVLESEARGRISEEEAIQYCKDKLAPYKIPKIVEFVGEIPRTDVGKVSRRELREGEE